MSSVARFIMFVGLGFVARSWGLIKNLLCCVQAITSYVLRVIGLCGQMVSFCHLILHCLFFFLFSFSWQHFEFVGCFPWALDGRLIGCGIFPLWMNYILVHCVLIYCVLVWDIVIEKSVLL
ncbi:hypothetical protein BDV32DRAFT_40948 [Aspergillus pseudonomiae]|nr:hypothetical protein BDV32DRAFT_40948 [Aspergillus pseudonomiae]